MALALAPRGVGVAALEREGRHALPGRGSIPISAAELPAPPTLELEAPDLIGVALRSELGGGWERYLANASPAPPEPPPEAAALADLAPLAATSPAGEPVAEPPAALLLSVAAGSWLAARRLRQPPKRGGRFARNASMPSTASASSRLSAITAAASR
jgi:hypothetical protein